MPAWSCMRMRVYTKWAARVIGSRHSATWQAGLGCLIRQVQS